MIVTCLALVESGESLCLQWVRFGADGLFPTRIAKECSRSFSHATANLLGGGIAATLALFLNHVPLLKVSLMCFIVFIVFFYFLTKIV